MFLKQKLEMGRQDNSLLTLATIPERSNESGSIHESGSLLLQSLSVDGQLIEKSHKSNTSFLKQPSDKKTNSKHSSGSKHSHKSSRSKRSSGGKRKVPKEGPTNSLTSVPHDSSPMSFD